MATTGEMLGTPTVIYVEGTKISKGSSNGSSFAVQYVDTSNKDSGGFQTGLAGQKSGSFSYEGVFAEDASYGYEDLFAVFLSGAAVTVKQATNVTGDMAYSAECIMTALELTAPNNELQTFSATFQTTGAISKAANA